ncbi:MAG: DUF2271 domain-containing protein [Verrucomicrobiales bacterium]|nr:DUF2271 domain-containing protein [Verrucomicrobiales bacterium]
MKPLCLSALLGAVLQPVWTAPAATQVLQHENVLGTSLELRVTASTDGAIAASESAVLAEIDRLDRIISTYRDDSEFSRWMRTSGQAVKVAPELLEVLALFERWQERSRGAFNAGAEAVGAVWRNAARENREPTPAEINGAIALAHPPHWQLDLAAGTATRRSRSPLTLDAAGKGWIIDRACAAALAVQGVEGVVLNLGGDVAVRGNAAEPVDIANPRDSADNAAPLARLRLREQAVATSGDYRRGVEIGGRRFSHLIDPRTGRPAAQAASATVVAARAADADALATIFSVLTPTESLALAAELPGVDCLLVTPDGRRVTTPGWSRLQVPLEPPATSGSPIDVTDAGEVVVQLELARITNQRAARPFVAVWIADEDRYPVRTLALWFNSPRWLPDLRSWYQDEQLRSLTENSEIIATVSSATRAPGRYTLKWDGRDNTGKPVKPGRYTVLIEASREHGTHQLMKQEIEFPGPFREVPLPGNVEIASASVAYQRKAGAR